MRIEISRLHKRLQRTMIYVTHDQVEAMTLADKIVGLGGLRVFSGLVFEPLVASNAVSYGALGTVLIMQSWLIGVGWVVYGGQLFGCWFYDAWLRAWARSRRGQAEPGGGQKGGQDPGRQAHRPE
jgi:hypothetical protein